MEDQAMKDVDRGLSTRLADLSKTYHNEPSFAIGRTIAAVLFDAYNSGHIVTTADHLSAVEKAVAAEREAIALMLDARAAQFDDDSPGDDHNTNAAYMVRSRGVAP